LSIPTKVGAGDGEHPPQQVLHLHFLLLSGSQLLPPKSPDFIVTSMDKKTKIQSTKNSLCFYEQSRKTKIKTNGKGANRFKIKHQKCRKATPQEYSCTLASRS